MDNVQFELTHWVLVLSRMFHKGATNFGGNKKVSFFNFQMEAGVYGASGQLVP